MSIVKDERIAHVWRIVKVVKVTMGLTFGLYLFTYGPYLYEKLGGQADPKMGMFLAMALYVIDYALEIVLEVPTGAIGDAIGRVSTVVWALTFRMFFFIGLTAMAIFQSVTISFTIGIIAFVIFAVAYTLFSGTFTAWCVDSLREAAPDIGYEHILSRAYIYDFAFQIVGSVIGILCYQHGLIYIAYILAAFVCLSCATFCRGEMKESKNISFLNVRDVNGKAIFLRMGEIIVVGFNVCRRTSAIFWLIMIFASYMFLINIIEYLWPVYLKSTIQVKTMQTRYWLGLSLLILATNLVGSYFLTWMGNRWRRNGGPKTHNSALRHWFIASTIVASLPVMILSGFSHFYNTPFLVFVIAIMAVELSYGVIGPGYETLLNNYIPDSRAGERATIMSFGNMLRGLIVLSIAIPASGGSGAATISGWIIPASLLLICVIVGGHRLKRAEVASAVESADGSCATES